MKLIALPRIFAWAIVCGVCVSCAGPALGPKTEKLDIEPMTFRDLPSWEEDHQAEAVPAFLKSCAVFEKRDPDTALMLSEAGKVADWLDACDAAKQETFLTDDQARTFFERYFTPYRVTNGQDGLFTGYYEAQLRGSWKKTASFQTPLWARPKDMLTVDLGAFRDSWAGQKITGKIEGSSFVPYDERAKIARGALEKRATPLVWVDDPIGAFFLEIQGSGQIQMDDGSVVRVGYDAQNGHGYTPIGRVLADRGEIGTPVSMQKIRAWLAAHPQRAQEIMDTNPSVVFFRKVDRDGAVGAQGAVLTAGRSMAVDRAFLPLGVPLWLVTAEDKRLVVAQDTGGAIKGPVRGDLFLGAGSQAEDQAGRMQERGTYYLLLPKGVQVRS
ncbi:MAG: murein transglycosylase A [Alphaproteobacteria bacterium]|nr:murein transglycosylase A [Alphaproteobacteria bacterium]